MTGMKNCILCFNEFEEADVPCYPPKLPELCCKYLHSSLTQEILANHSNHHNVQFCPKCFESMMKLSDVHDQLEFHQKEISETSFIQSLEILHRRGKRLNSSCDQKIPNHNQSDGKLIQFDVSALPNCDFKKANSDISDAFVTSAENYCNFSSPEDDCDEDLLLIHSSAENVDTVDVTFENIKVDSEEFIDETHDESNSTIDMDAKYFERTEQNSDVSTGDSGNKNRDPILKQCLKYCDSDHKIQKVMSMENEQDNFGAENGQMKLQTFWTKSDLLNGSYNMSAVNQTHSDSDNGQISSTETPDNNTSTRGDKLNHQLNPLFSEAFRCPVCNEKFRTEQELKDHVHSEEQSSKSDVGEKFKPKGYLLKNNIIHSRKRSLNNEVSKRRFRLPHEIGHANKKLFTGVFSPTECTILSNPITQGGIHPGKKPYKCEVCGKEFTTQCILTNHSRTHTGERPYKCDVCGRTFTQLGPLVAHSRLHTGEKPYKCELCGKRFTQLGTLISHNRVHTGERPYKCEVCGKGFAQQRALITHNRVHTGERPYICGYCPKRFTTQGNLTTHNRIHSEERPYKCEVCGKRFTQQSISTRHSRTHHHPS